ncbi:MAG: murein biosynthesis integral membrane protein MurJ, partial [Gammaproteobacteria bacterium]
RSLISHVMAAMALVLTVITTVGMLLAPLLIWIFAPGFGDEPNKFELATTLLRITFPYLLFISLTALAAGILNSYGYFAAPALAPIFLNICLISGALTAHFYLHDDIRALAWGVFVAGLLQFMFLLPFLKKLRLLPRPRLKLADEGVRRIGRLMLPALFGSSVMQVNLLLDTLIASFLVTGSISWLYYSNRLVEFPLGVFGIALSTVVLPSLSSQFARRSLQDYSRTLDWAIRWIWLIAPAATLGLVILSQPVLISLFEYGQFGPQDARMASYSLMAYGSGLTAFIFVKVLATAFYSRQDTKTPVRIGIIAMASNMVMNIALVFPLQHAGLALATALSSCLNAGLLFLHLKRQRIYTPCSGWAVFFIRIALANLVMTLLLLTAVPEPETWRDWSWTLRIMELLKWIGMAILVYTSSLLILGIRPRQLISAHHE